MMMSGNLDRKGHNGKSVGIVTTARVTHATPGAAYAKIPHREWETDADIVSPWFGSDRRNCDSSLKDIARQLVEDNHRIHVVMGGGRRSLMNNKTMDPVHNKPGKRIDGRDLIKTWESKQEEKGARYKYVWNREQMEEVDDNVDYLLGLFDYSHMAYDSDRYEKGTKSQPSLADMTAKAIKILRKNKKGFFLFVEGAAIDLGHHANLAHKALLEGIALDRAVKTATDLTQEADTLTMVTADHSHVFNIAGYPVRGHPIL
ncbi:alkaline phosphatase, partial [Elysia marginata]